MNHTDLAALAAASGFHDVAAILRSGSAEADQLFSVILAILADAPGLTAVHPSAPQVASSDVTYEQAIEWAHQVAQQLVSDTHYLPSGAMEEDFVGASGATIGPLKNYLSTPADAPPEVHLAALKILRIHSKTQLDSDTFDEAIAAIQKRAGADAKPVKRIYHYKESVKSGLTDGTHYVYVPERKEVRVYLPYRTSGKKGWELLRDGGIERGITRFDYGPGTNGKNWLVVPLGHVDAVGRALAPDYPEAAAALVQNAVSWGAQVGIADGPRTQTDRQVVEGSNVHQFPATQNTPQAGSVEGFRYVWEEPQFRIILAIPQRLGRSIDFARHFFPTAGTSMTKDWHIVIPTTVIEVAATAMANDFPQLTATLRRFLPVWTATKAELRQTQEEGVAEGGQWRVHKDVLYVKTGYIQAKWWNTVPRARLIRNAPFLNFPEWVIQVPIKNALKLAHAARPHFPRLAEALTRTFGGVARVFEEEADVCAPLLDLHDKVDISQVTNPMAIQALSEVERAFEIRAPADFRPLPFQAIGIAFAKITGYRALIGDSMGLGKTAQAIGAIITDPEMLLPAVICAPTNVAMSWAKHCRRWVPTIPVYLLMSQRTPLPPRDWRGIVLTTWDTLREQATALVQWKPALFVADEAHYGKNRTALRTKAMMAVGQASEHCLLMTGTPIKNTDVTEIWPLLSTIDKETWGTVKAFANEYVAETQTFQTEGGATITKFSGVKSAEDLRSRLACTMVRRTKTAALPYLPKKRRIYLEIEVPREMWGSYKKAEDDFKHWLEAKFTTAAHAAGVDPRYLSAEVQAKILKSMRAETIVQIGELRKLTGRMKVRAAVEPIRAVLSSGEPAVAWCFYKETVAFLMKEFSDFRVVRITDDVPAAERSAIEDRFQAGEIDLIVASQAAKEGITLTKACVEFFVERFWTPADEQQAEDRLHRISQTREVLVFYLHVLGTIDDYVRHLIAGKRAMIDEILGSEEEDKKSPDVVDSEEQAVEGIADFLAGAKIGRPTEGFEVQAITDVIRQNPILPAGAALARGEIVQTILVPKDRGLAQARHWVSVNGYVVGKVDPTDHFWRFRQANPSGIQKGTFRTITLLDGVRLVVGRRG